MHLQTSGEENSCSWSLKSKPKKIFMVEERGKRENVLKWEKGMGE